MHLLRMRRHQQHKIRRKRCRVMESTVCIAKVAVLNSNMTLGFKREVVAWSKLHNASKNSQNTHKAASDS